MEPRIQYTKTSDGVNIAYAVAGDDDGPVVVRLPPVPWSHVAIEWEDFSLFLVTKTLPNCRTVWYDSHGAGLFDRDNLDFSIEAMVRDLEAVLDRLDAERAM